MSKRGKGAESAWSSNTATSSSDSGYSGSAGATPPTNHIDLAIIMNTVEQQLSSHSATLDAKQEVFEGRIDQRLTEMGSKLTKIDSLPSTTSMVVTAITTVAGGVGLLLAVLAYSGDRADGGISLGVSVGERFVENRLEIEKLRQNEAETNDRILKALEGIQARLDGDAAEK